MRLGVLINVVPLPAIEIEADASGSLGTELFKSAISNSEVSTDRQVANQANRWVSLGVKLAENPLQLRVSGNARLWIPCMGHESGSIQAR